MYTGILVTSIMYTSICIKQFYMSQILQTGEYHIGQIYSAWIIGHHNVLCSDVNCFITFLSFFQKQDIGLNKTPFL